MPASVGVVTFPGSLDDRDAQRAVRLAGAEPVALWHADADLHGVDAVVLPGGFSYGDYLRCGAIARFAKVMPLIVDAARGGMPVLGICNGFQILCESPPAARCAGPQRPPDVQLPRPAAAHRERLDCLDQRLHRRRRGGDPAQERRGRLRRRHATLDLLEGEGRVVARYVGRNPNGSYRDIAGISNEQGNVVGLMPHPEHAIEDLTGPSTDGLAFFTSVLKGLVSA